MRTETDAMEKCFLSHFSNNVILCCLRMNCSSLNQHFFQDFPCKDFFSKDVVKSPLCVSREEVDSPRIE